VILAISLALSDHDLRMLINSNELFVSPINGNTIQQNGIDFRLADEIGEQTPTDEAIIDTSSTESVKSHYKTSKSTEGFFHITPLTHYLLTTTEEVKMPTNLVGFCGLRSTFARLGFVCPLTIVDAGFEGSLTIGVFYGGKIPLKVPVGSRFLHVVFARLISNSDLPYDGHYKRQKGVSLPKSLL
jgi:dCTP deaminase